MWSLPLFVFMCASAAKSTSSNNPYVHPKSTMKSDNTAPNNFFYPETISFEGCLTNITCTFVGIYAILIYTIFTCCCKKKPRSTQFSGSTLMTATSGMQGSQPVRAGVAPQRITLESGGEQSSVTIPLQEAGGVSGEGTGTGTGTGKEASSDEEGTNENTGTPESLVQAEGGKQGLGLQDVSETGKLPTAKDIGTKELFDDDAEKKSFLPSVAFFLTKKKETKKTKKKSKRSGTPSKSKSISWSMSSSPTPTPKKSFRKKETPALKKKEKVTKAKAVREVKPEFSGGNDAFVSIGATQQDSQTQTGLSSKI